ncbi:MAG: hypothetical protein AAGA60_18320 [Cyanobacteria bacterium P01_E01_bin.42]
MNSFSVEEWEIWYTFSTYIKTHIDDLKKVAKLLVDLDIAVCSVMSEGTTFCQTNCGVISGQTTLELSGDVKQASIKFQPDDLKEVILTPYTRETWLVGARFLYGEARQISPEMELPTIHLRAFLKPFV